MSSRPARGTCATSIILLVEVLQVFFLRILPFSSHLISYWLVSYELKNTFEREINKKNKSWYQRIKRVTPNHKRSRPYYGYKLVE